jgi:hypothetical protein
LVADGKKVDLMTKGSFPTNIAQFIQKYNDDGLSEYFFLKTPWRGRNKYALTVKKS